MKAWTHDYNPRRHFCLLAGSVGMRKVSVACHHARTHPPKTTASRRTCSFPCLVHVVPINQEARGPDLWGKGGRRRHLVLDWERRCVGWRAFWSSRPPVLGPTLLGSCRDASPAVCNGGVERCVCVCVYVCVRHGAGWITRRRNDIYLGMCEMESKGRDRGEFCGGCECEWSKHPA